MATGHVIPGMSPRKARIASKLDFPTLLATLLVIPALLLTFSDLNETWRTVSTIFNWTIYSWFVIEFLLMMYLSPSIKHYVTHNKVDILVLATTLPVLSGTLQVLWVLRLFRLIDMFPHFLEKYVPVRLAHYTLIITFITLFGGGIAFSHLEDISLFDGIYWCSTTVTSVGYGDFSPTTTTSKILTMVVQWIGQGILGLIVADIIGVTKRLLRVED